MSAPQTNIERQKRRHAGPILGSVLAVCFVLGMFFAYTTFVASEGETPVAAEADTDDAIDVAPASDAVPAEPEATTPLPEEVTADPDATTPAPDAGAAAPEPTEIAPVD